MTTDSTQQQQRLQQQLQQQQRQSMYLMSQNPNMQFQAPNITGGANKRPPLVPIDTYACVPPTRKYKSPYTLSGKQSFTNFVAQIANGPSATSALASFLPMRYSGQPLPAQSAAQGAVSAAATGVPAPGMVGISTGITTNVPPGIVIPQPPPPVITTTTASAAGTATSAATTSAAAAATSSTSQQDASAAQQQQQAQQNSSMLSYAGYSTAGAAAAAAAAATNGTNPRALLSVKHPGVGPAPTLSETGYDGNGNGGGSGSSGSGSGCDLGDAGSGDAGMMGGYKPPMQASWFKMNAIHDIEKRALPDFFTGKSPFKTPEVYKEYRDYMITAAQQNRQQNISFAQCRRYLMGDVITLLRVYQFLEHWGLINANVSGQRFLSRSTSVPPERQTPAAAAAPTQQQQQQSRSQQPKSQQIKTQAPPPPMTAAAVAKSTPITVAAAAAAMAHSASKPPPGSETAPTLAQQPPPQTPPAKSAQPPSSSPLKPQSDNPSADASVQVKVEKDSDARVERSNGGVAAAEPRPKLVGDWINPEDLAPVDEGVWTEGERGRLLDALLSFQGKWDDVAAAVGTKTREQCLQYFLQMPIEDPYLEDQVAEAALLRKEAIAREKTLGDSKVLGLASLLAATVGEGEEADEGGGRAARIYDGVARAMARSEGAGGESDGTEVKEFIDGVEGHARWIGERVAAVKDMEKRLADEWVNVEAARKSLITERLALLQSIAPDKVQEIIQ